MVPANDNHGEYGESDRQLIADHLRTRAESADEGELVGRRPIRRGEDAEDAYRRASDQEEYADVEVDDLKPVAPGKDTAKQSIEARITR